MTSRFSQARILTVAGVLAVVLAACEGNPGTGDSDGSVTPGSGGAVAGSGGTVAGSGGATGSGGAIGAVTGISLSRSQLRLDPGVSGALTATVAPVDAIDKVVTWSSDKEDVATVDSSGKVTAVAAGQAVITATTHDGSFTATCKVFVFSPYFTDDFEAGSGKWDLLPVAGPNGAFSVATDGSQVLKYSASTVGGVLATVKDSAWTGVTTGDYYVEARIKPQSNSTTGNKLLYLVARYQDSSNYFAGGLNVQSSTASTAIEMAKVVAGTMTRPLGQVKRPIAMDANWYTVRFELVGSTLTTFLDGELIKTVTDPALVSGKIGLYTANKSFEIDDVQVGDPKDRPVQLTLAPTTATYVAEAGDAPYTLTVAAQVPDYETGAYSADTFTVESSDPTVVSVSVNGTSISLTPLKQGTATITVTSGSLPSLKRTITASIGPAFIQPTTVYDLTGRVSPAAGEVTAYPDGRLSITFDSAPTLGTTGSVRIFRKSDNVAVDVIKPGAEIQTMAASATQARICNVESLIKVSGNTVTITPHNGKLAYATEYYVAIGADVITGTTLGGTAFNGIGVVGGWSFTTQAAPATTLTSVVVDDDGIADFRTVQGALTYFMTNAAAATAVTVNVKNGTYEELLLLRGKNNVTIVGESRDDVVIQYRNNEVLNGGSGASQVLGGGTPAGGRSVLLVETSDMLTLSTLTLKNTTTRSSAPSAQAETIYFNNDAGHLIGKYANFISEQDTLQLKGYGWFFQSLVAGNVDFIWGANKVALFEDCEIRSLGDSANASSGGYIVQARTTPVTEKGFVFLLSRLTHGVGPGGNDVPSGAGAGASYLARSAGSGTAFDNVTFVSCKMGDHIIGSGWYTSPLPNPNPGTATSGWREYGSTDLAGNPLDLTGRWSGAYQLNATEAAGLDSRSEILGTWAPVP